MVKVVADMLLADCRVTFRAMVGGRWIAIMEVGHEKRQANGGCC